jgi:hypothetical protein
MARFYFDTRDDDQLFPDDEGMDLDGGLACGRSHRGIRHID